MYIVLSTWENFIKFLSDVFLFFFMTIKMSMGVYNKEKPVVLVPQAPQPPKCSGLQNDIKAFYWHLFLKSAHTIYSV